MGQIPPHDDTQCSSLPVFYQRFNSWSTKAHKWCKASIPSALPENLEDGGQDGKHRCFQDKLVIQLSRGGGGGVGCRTCSFVLWGRGEESLQRSLKSGFSFTAQAQALRRQAAVPRFEKTVGATEMLTRGAHHLCQKPQSFLFALPASKQSIIKKKLQLPKPIWQKKKIIIITNLGKWKTIYVCAGVGSSDWNEEKWGQCGCQTELDQESLFLEHGA